MIYNGIHVSEIVEMAWNDKISFDIIKSNIGLSETEIINIMRRHIRSRSFCLWRKRVSGRVAKHSSLMKKNNSAASLI